jgi:hypothetical protein
VDDLEHNEGYNGLQLRALSEHLQDPDFWKALATARKWEDTNAWRFHWHRFIDHLADGKDAESFFASLWKSTPAASFLRMPSWLRPDSGRISFENSYQDKLGVMEKGQFDLLAPGCYVGVFEQHFAGPLPLGA